MRNLKRALSLALASIMVLGLMVVGSSAVGYTDVTDEHNTEAIEVLQGVTPAVMEGTGDNKFEPEKQLTRNEMAVIMCRLLDYTVASYKGTSNFTDVPAGHWAEEYVAACYTNKIIAGYSDTYYGGDDVVTTGQAGLMILKALGYFQEAGDFGADWLVETVAVGSKAGIFGGIEKGARESLTRNDAAQMCLNALEAEMVTIGSHDLAQGANGQLTTKAVYEPRTGSDSKYNKIDNATYGNGSGSSNKIINLGEYLYDGDLKKETASDDFGRPATIWSFKSSEIGTYADGAEETWTGKVSEKALYTTVGSSAYDSYSWTIYQNGAQRFADKGSDHAARDAAIANSKTSSERVLSSGDGVLTQVFVDSNDQTVVLTMVDTGVAEVTRVTEDDGDYEVTVSLKTKVNKGDKTAFTPSTTFKTPVKFEKGDVVIYTASVSSGEIESMAVAETVTGKVTAQKDKDYTYLDGEKYGYNFAYTKAKASYGIDEGIYNLDDGQIDNPDVDKEVTLYLDASGKAVAFKGDTNSPEDYLFITEVGKVFNSEPSAKVVFSDGTKATINVDKVTVTDKNDVTHILDAGADGVTDTDYDKDDNDGTVDSTASGGDNAEATTYELDTDTIYKFTAGSNSYDLEVVKEEGHASNSEVKKDNPTIKWNSGSGSAVANNDTVIVDAENGRSWTGYKNVASMTGASCGVKVVKDSDGVVIVAFVYGTIERAADDEDFIILTGTGIEAVKDAKNKTVYRLTSAYDIHGEKIDDLYQLSSTAPTVKGLYLISSRDGDDYIRTMGLKAALVNKTVNGVSYVSAGGGTYGGGDNTIRYATTAGSDLIVLNDAINTKTAFGYNGDTEFIVVTQNVGGDVDTISVGSFGDIEANESGDNDDRTGVYVMTVDDDSKDAPVAETVLVVVPYTGSKVDTSANVSSNTVAISGTSVTYTVAEGAAEPSAVQIRDDVLAKLGQTWNSDCTFKTGSGHDYDLTVDGVTYEITVDDSANEITITYDADGETAAAGSINAAATVRKNAAYTAPACGMTVASKTFMGWATSSGGAVVYAQGATVPTTGDITLYAVFKSSVKTINVTGSGSAPSGTTNTGTYTATASTSGTTITITVTGSQTSGDKLEWTITAPTNGTVKDGTDDVTAIVITSDGTNWTADHTSLKVTAEDGSSQTYTVDIQ